jgi:hypothetical protein
MSREIIRMPTQVIQMNTQQMAIQKAMQDTALATQQIMQAMQTAMIMCGPNAQAIAAVRAAADSGRQVILYEKITCETET